MFRSHDSSFLIVHTTLLVVGRLINCLLTRYSRARHCGLPKPPSGGRARGESARGESWPCTKMEEEAMHADGRRMQHSQQQMLLGPPPRKLPSTRQPNLPSKLKTETLLNQTTRGLLHVDYCNCNWFTAYQHTHTASSARRTSRLQSCKTLLLLDKDKRPTSPPAPLMRPARALLFVISACQSRRPRVTTVEKQPTARRRRRRRAPPRSP